MFAFRYCKFCGGRCCIACPSELEKYEAAGPQPIFTARIGNDSDMELLARFASKGALDKAFGPGGGGIAEVEREAAMASLLQFMRDHRGVGVEAPPLQENLDATPLPPTTFKQESLL